MKFSKSQATSEATGKRTEREGGGRVTNRGTEVQTHRKMQTNEWTDGERKRPTYKKKMQP